MIDTPHPMLPLRLAGTQLATVEQDSTVEIIQRARLLCFTPPGWLDGRPGLGLANQAFRKGGPDTALIERQITTWVPQAAAVVATQPGALNDTLAYVGVRIST